VTPIDSVEEPLVHDVDVGLKEDGEVPAGGVPRRQARRRGASDPLVCRAAEVAVQGARAKYYEPSNREIGVTIQSGDMT
jgi:hypothetical protein